MKKNGLFPIIDHSDMGQAKDLFIYGILAYHPDGDMNNLIKVNRDDKKGRK